MGANLLPIESWVYTGFQAAEPIARTQRLCEEELEVILRKHVHALVWAYRHATGKLRVPELDALSRYLSIESICFDVGAHGGSWSRGLARIVLSGHEHARLTFEAMEFGDEPQAPERPRANSVRSAVKLRGA